MYNLFSFNLLLITFVIPVHGGWQLCTGISYVTLNEEAEGKWQVLSILEFSQHLIYLGSIFTLTEGAANTGNLHLSILYFRHFLGFPKGICYLIYQLYQIKILYIELT